jgi:hypothetical protein
MKKIWVQKSDSFQKAAKFNIEYYVTMSPSERLETMQFLREMISKLNKGRSCGKNRKRLRRTIKIIQ